MTINTPTHNFESEPSRFRYEPRTMAEAMSFADAVVKSGLVPHIRKAEAAFVIIVTGAELGLTAMQSLRSIHIIDGKPTLSADLLVGLVKRSPVCQWLRVVESTEQSAIYETLRRGDPKPTRYAYTLEDARRANLLGKRSWRQFPAAMLRARCASALARAVYPDLVAGVYDPDELDHHADDDASRARLEALQPSMMVAPEDVEDLDGVSDAPVSQGAEDADALDAAPQDAGVGEAQGADTGETQSADSEALEETPMDSATPVEASLTEETVEDGADAEAPTTTEDVEASTVEDVEAPAVVKDVEAPAVVEDVEAPAVVEDVEAPAVVEDVEAPVAVEDVEVSAATEEGETDVIEDVEAPAVEGEDVDALGEVDEEEDLRIRLELLQGEESNSAAARFAAKQLALDGTFGNPGDAMQALAKAVRARDIDPREATLEDLALAWQTLTRHVAVAA